MEITGKNQNLPHPRTSSNDLDNIPQPYLDVAQGMEKQFLEFMISQMKNSVNRAEEPDSAMNYYESLLTEEQAQQITSQNGGLGLQKLILDQVYPEYLRNQANMQQHNSSNQAIKSYRSNDTDHSSGRIK